jgi:uncharacterized protein (TIGR02001 family)
VKHLKTSIVAAAIGIALAPAVHAQASANVGAVSNYIWRGVTQTQDGPAIQGGLDYAHESGLFIGTWASNVEFFDDNQTEVDVYAGYGGKIDEFSYKLGVYQYLYFGVGDGFHPGNFTEIGISGTYGILTLGVNYTIGGAAPKDALFNDGDVYPYISLNYAIDDNWSVGATAGYYSFDEYDSHYSHAQLTVSRAAGDFGTFSFNVGKAWLKDDLEGVLIEDKYVSDAKVWVSWIKTF